MKNSKYIYATLLTSLVLLSGCRNEDPKKEAEASEENKVGKVYNPEETGNGHETRDNQFPSSRNDNKKGTGLETGAQTDTSSVTTKDNIPRN